MLRCASRKTVRVQSLGGAWILRQHREGTSTKIIKTEDFELDLVELEKALGHANFFLLQ